MKASIKKQEVKFIVTDEYGEWIALIKDRIRNSQIKASIKVNRELLELYWHIGEDIVNRQKHSKWGEGLLRQMSIDLKKTFPDMAGFSETNLKTMRLWYRFYAEAVNGQQVVDELRSDDIFRLITTIPWGHNQRIIFKCKDVREAVFYAQYTLENPHRKISLHCKYGTIHYKFASDHGICQKYGCHKSHPPNMADWVNPPL